MSSKNNPKNRKASSENEILVGVYHLWLDGVRRINATMVRFPDKREVFFRERLDRSVAIRRAEQEAS